MAETARYSVSDSATVTKPANKSIVVIYMGLVTTNVSVSFIRSPMGSLRALLRLVPNGQ